MGWVSKHGKLWCVHNEATGRVIVVKGKRRCYRSRKVALQTWYRLDCYYTGRHCEKIRR